MKKLIKLLSFLGCAYFAQAQDISTHSLGLRFGDNDGFGSEISYQHGLSKSNRLEVDLGWRNSNNVEAFKLAGVYQWVWNIDGGFNWYAGAGGGIGSWSYSKNGVSDKRTFVFAAGDIGIEYNFHIPLQLSLDFRPEIYSNSDSFRDNGFGPDIALGIRYRF